MRSFVLKPSDIKRSWYLIDASDNSLGRIAGAAAKLLVGKNKPGYTPHVDGGDFVIIVNGSNLKVTGKKLQNKRYYRHSGHPGNLRTASLQEELEKSPSKVIEMAVFGMLPVNKLRRSRLSRLKVYDSSEHMHEAQNPVNYSVKGDK